MVLPTRAILNGWESAASLRSHQLWIAADRFHHLHRINDTLRIFRTTADRFTDSLTVVKAKQNLRLVLSSASRQTTS